MEVWQYFVDPNQLSTLGQVRTNPEWFEQLIRRLHTKKVSKLKEFFKSYLALIHNKYDVMELIALIEYNTTDFCPERRVNQVKIKWKTGQEL